MHIDACSSQLEDGFLQGLSSELVSVISELLQDEDLWDTSCP
jgi:hypothetical protein